MNQQLEFVYFEGCPNASLAREHLTSALASAGLDGSWTEWDLQGAETPPHIKRYGSPTILVDGVDVTGEGAGTSAMACRSDGVPSVDLIVAALSPETTAG